MMYIQEVDEQKLCQNKSCVSNLKKMCCEHEQILRLTNARVR